MSEDLQNTQPENLHRPLLALFLRLLAIMSLSTLYMLVKYAGENGVSLAQIMFWRPAIPAVCLLIFLAMKGRLSQLRTQRLSNHGMRSVIGTLGMLTNFGAAILLPLAISTTLGFTTPLFAVILAALVFREPVGPWRWFAVVLGFVGVLVITQPGFAPISPLGAAVGLLAAFVIALVSYQIRDLNRTEPSIAIVFYFSAFGAAMALPFQPFTDYTLDASQWLLLVAAGAVGMVSQLLLTASLRYGAVSSVIVMDYSSLIWATFFGWAIWDSLPPATMWIGAPLVIGAGLLVTWREHRLARQPSPASALEGE